MNALVSAFVAAQGATERLNVYVGHIVEKVCAASAGAIYRIVPIGNPPVFVQAGMNFHDGSRVESVKEEFLGPGPGNLHRFTRDSRQASCFNGLAPGALATKSTTNIGCNYAYLFGIHVQDFGNFIPCGEGRLGRSPHCHPAILDLGYCGMRFDRCMCDISLAERHIKRMSGSIACSLHVAAA